MIDFKAGICTRKIFAMAPKIQSITKAKALMKVQTYNCFDTSNNSVLFTRQKDKKQMDIELIFHTKITYSLKNNISTAFYFSYNQNF